MELDTEDRKPASPFEWFMRKVMALWCAPALKKEAVFP